MGLPMFRSIFQCINRKIGDVSKGVLKVMRRR
jgi:hypothetical protein